MSEVPLSVKKVLVLKLLDLTKEKKTDPGVT